MKITNFIKCLPAVLTIGLFFPLGASAQSGETPASNSVTSDEPAGTNYNEPPYNRYMRLGYAASQRGDYPDALRYFASALAERPRDRNATLAYWNVYDIINNQTQQQAATNNSEIESDYDRYMRIGYDATQQEDYQTALINFRRALEERPQDPYALQAIRNVSTYINRGQEAATQR
ncbi:MAG: hypothetical protein SAL07_05500 [Oscillatoria sp. PMC 1051.18]|nr:hypothetical protein [Oscillatoria sp. PMC 1051.18]